jgi:hypothetical protein
MNDQELRIAINAVDNASAVLKKAQANVEGSMGKVEESFDSAQQRTQEFGKGLKTVSVATAAIGAGLTIYAKNATDFVTGMAKDAKSLSRETGATEVEASKLLAVMGRMGVSADAASGMFGIFSKQITAARNATADNAQKTADLTSKIKDNALQHDVLNNKLAATQIEIAKVTAEIKKNGDKTGELHNKLQALQLDTRSYQNDLSNLTDQTANYRVELTKSTDPLQAINVATKNADGTARGFNDILLDVADRFKEMPASAEKTALAMQLFGRSGKDMIKILNQGSQGIKDLEASAEKMGLTLTAKNIGQINDYIKSTKALKETSDALKISVGTLTAPVLANFNNRVNKMEKALFDANTPFHGLLVNTLAFGGPIAGATSGVTAFAGNLVSAGPIVSKFAATLGNPYVLAAVAATAAIGFLGFEIVKHTGLSKLFTAEIDTSTQAMYRSEAQVRLLDLATERLTNAKLAAKNAEEGLQRLESAQPALSQLVADARAAVAQRQQELNDAVTQYGPTSDQAYLATLRLQDAQAALNAQLVSSGSNTLNVVHATGQLRDANNELADATSNLIKLTDGLANSSFPGLRVSMQGVEVQAQSTAEKVIQAFSPVADQVLNFNGRLGTLQSTSSEVTSKIMQNFGQIQSSASETTRQLNQLPAQSGGLKVRATGGEVSAGQAYIVGENRPEVFVPNTSGRIEPTAPSGGGETKNILSGNFYFSTKDSVDAFFEKLDKTQRLARLGMA